MKKACVVTFVLSVLFIMVLTFIWVKSTDSSKDEKKNYANVSDLDNVGSLDDDYEVIEDNGTEYYAKLVSNDELSEFDEIQYEEEESPMKRLERLQGTETLPRISRNVTPYNVDVADPKTHSYMVNPPRVQLKDPQWLQADPYRGDINITYHPNISLVNRTRFGRDSLRADGYFSESQEESYRKYTGRGYKNIPMKVVNEELIMDY